MSPSVEPAAVVPELPSGKARDAPPGLAPRPRVVCVGDIVTDVLAVLGGPIAPGSDTPAAIRVTGGGQAANTAAWLAHLGYAVTLAGAVGDDEAGRDRLVELRDHGVDCAVQVCPDASTGAIVVLSGAGERTMITDRGANVLLSAQTVEAALEGATHLHLSAYTLLDERSRAAGLAALAAARAHGLSTSVDAASTEPLRAAGQQFLSWCSGVSLLVANADEAELLAGRGTPPEQARRLADAVGSAVVKLGGAGAVWAGPHGIVTAQAPAVTAVDTTGAGDAFAAGLLGALLTGAAPEVALRAGVQAGSQAVAHLGARPPGGGRLTSGARPSGPAHERMAA